ncbi:uncharacterized protein LTR77_010131 [Saxophila tyrrhenica]|uniref:Uncharacterized protein n=1 Tax=Saxophila tyrrhenica TaxID=1690608 RepID=A0AAV9NYL3_9PEZI|nr:hypothetical protein LTR77_010131 [Saxophila tyrrhenica]
MADFFVATLAPMHEFISSVEPETYDPHCVRVDPHSDPCPRGPDGWETMQLMCTLEIVAWGR